MAIPLTEIDIVITTFNQESIIKKIIQGVCDRTTTPFNLIMVFDGCTDNTKPYALSFLEDNKKNYPLLKELRTTDTPDVHETRSNNAGLKMATSDYVIMIQDDMLIEETGWERRMTFPIRSMPDVFSVGSRGGFDIVSMTRTEQVYENKFGREFFNFDRNIFAVRDYVNRGPIAFDRKKLAMLNFLDEAFAPCNLDDADICLRAWQDHQWKSGIYWIDYYSPEKWSTTKRTDLSIRKEPASRAKNSEILNQRYSEYFRSKVKHTEDIVLPWKSVDYPESVSKNKIGSEIFISNVKFLSNILLTSIKRFLYRVEKAIFRVTETETSKKTEYVDK